MNDQFRKITTTLFFALIHLQNFYVYEFDWYRKKSASLAVKKYYRTLREILRSTSPKHRVLTRCVHCGIFF